MFISSDAYFEFEPNLQAGMSSPSLWTGKPVSPQTATVKEKLTKLKIMFPLFSQLSAYYNLPQPEMYSNVILLNQQIEKIFSLISFIIIKSITLFGFFVLKNDQNYYYYN